MSSSLEERAEEVGSWEPTLGGELVHISQIGPDMVCIPGTVRRLRAKSTEANPMKLTSLLRPKTNRNRHPYVLITFECTPFVRRKLPRGKSELGHERTCFIRDLNDATDPLFDTLPEKQRSKIINSARLLYQVIANSAPPASSYSDDPVLHYVTEDSDDDLPPAA